MVRGKKALAQAPEAAVLQEPLAAEVESLRNEVRILRQAIDEIREELQYVNNNGVRLRDVDQLPPIGILKRMAADVSSSDFRSISATRLEQISIRPRPTARTNHNRTKAPVQSQYQRRLLRTQQSHQLSEKPIPEDRVNCSEGSMSWFAAAGRSTLPPVGNVHAFVIGRNKHIAG